MKIKLNDYDQGTFIRVIREWTGLTQKQFAKVLGKSERQIQYYESGERSYNVCFLKLITKDFRNNVLASITLNPNFKIKNF